MAMENTIEPAPVKVDAIKVQVHEVPRQQGRQYWIGCTEECPFKPIYLAGQDFPYEVTPPRERDGEWERDSKIGQVVSLTDEQVQRIKEAVVRKVVRWNAGRSRASILSTGHVAYQPQGGDEPLAKYVYMVPLAEGRLPEGYRERPGETMA